ncbi:hypothetical protein EVAR_76656_1 [Eumeta japonica]|uniref:Reverse transcriptase domain-containing protein n=1 Tax=Eumeta variegata TaxID=151549 RepID=A0A4C1T815_EUMVA|nr:hypothetical protein EVAR_76656_1 [Eumeta japonica]
MLLRNNLIEESYSPFAAPVTLAFKKGENRKSRLCVDFRELNKIVVPQAQPFPLIDDLITKTRNCMYFTTLDINSAFWAIPLRVEDRKKTGFVTQDGHFQWTCLPFGLKTSPAIFQRILSNILRKHNLTGYAINYIDDILIYSTTFEEHIRHIRNVLEAIIKEGFRLKFTKCTFASSSKYNETEHRVTGFAPKYLLDGTNVSIVPNEIKTIGKEDKWIADRILALENTIKSYKYNKKIFDRNRKMQEFEIGDSVYVENGNRLNRKKLDELKIGPFKIIEKISNSIYKIDTGNTKTESTLFHITKLHPVTAEDEVEENEYEDNL